MKFATKCLASVVSVFVVSSLCSDAQAQSGSRGGYSPPAMSASPSPSAPTYSAPAYSAPAYSAPAYSAPAHSAPNISVPTYSNGNTAAGSYRPSVSNAPFAQPRAVMSNYPQYPVFQSQPNYSARYGQYPANTAGPTYYSGYPQSISQQQFMGRPFSRCGH